MDLFWLVPGRLAGGSRPGGSRIPLVPISRRLTRDLARLEADGIGAVLTLTVRPLPADLLAQRGLVALHLPVRDFTAPSLEQLAVAVAWIDLQVESGAAVLVHCGGGRGRTGTVLAAWLVAHGQAVEAAVAGVRRVRPGAVETRGQLVALRRFAQDGSTESATTRRCDNQP